MVPLTLTVESSQFEMSQLVRVAIQEVIQTQDLTQLILKYLRYGLFDLRPGRTLRFSDYHKLSIGREGYEEAIVCGETAVNAQTPDLLLRPYNGIDNNSFLTRFNLETFQSANFNFHTFRGDQLTIHGSTIYDHGYHARSICIAQIKDTSVTISETIVIDAPEKDPMDLWPGKLIFDPIRAALFILKKDRKGSITVLNSNQQLTTFVPKEMTNWSCDFAAYLSDETIVGLYADRVIKFNLIDSSQIVINRPLDDTLERKTCLAGNYLATLPWGGPITVVSLSSGIVKPLIRPACINLCVTNDGSFCVLYKWGSKIDVITPIPHATSSQGDFVYSTNATLSLSHRISSMVLYEENLIAMVGTHWRSTSAFYKFSEIPASASSHKRKREEEKPDHKVDK